MLADAEEVAVCVADVVTDSLSVSAFVRLSVSETDRETVMVTVRVGTGVSVFVAVESSVIVSDRLDRDRVRVRGKEMVRVSPDAEIDLDAVESRLAESLVYAPDFATQKTVEGLAATYAGQIKALSGAGLEARKNEITQVMKALQYLAKAGVVPATFAPKLTLEQISKAAGWDDEKK